MTENNVLSDYIKELHRSILRTVIKKEKDGTLDGCELVVECTIYTKMSKGKPRKRLRATFLCSEMPDA